MENKTRNNTGKRYSDEVRERSIRMVLEHQHEYSSPSAAIGALATKIGCGADTLRKWVKQHEIDMGMESGVTSSDRDRMKELERENKQLRQVNEILRKASAFFAAAERAQ